MGVSGRESVKYLCEFEKQNTVTLHLCVKSCEVPWPKGN